MPRRPATLRRLPPARPRRPRGLLRRVGRWFGVGRSLGLLLLAGFVALRVWDPAPVEAIRVRTFDLFQTLQPRPIAPERPVVIVDIDEASLRELGQWPWPRTLVALLVAKLTGAGAAVIGFDIVFAEPDRLSPDRFAAGLGALDPAIRAALAALPGNDAVLADAIRAGRVVLGQTATGTTEAATATEIGRQTGIAVLGPDPAAFLPAYPGILANIPVLNDAAAGRGLFTITPERDGIVRRVPTIAAVGGVLLPSLTVEVLRVLTGAGALLLRSDEAGILSVHLGPVDLPTDPHGQVWVHFSAPDPDRFVPAADVLADRVDAARIEGKIVLVGTSAVGLLDNKTTPLARATPGVEVHAQVLEAVLAGATLAAPPYALSIEILVAVAVSFTVILFAPILGAFTLLLLGGAVAACLVAASWYRFAHDGLLLDATFPLATSFTIYATLVFTNYFREQLGRNRIRSAFGQYLSPALVEQLAHSPEKLRLGGEERRMTILFSDVRGFTGVAETFRHDPQGLTALMNRFLTPLTNAIIENRGTIDKYMGDAIMAFWNAPLDDGRQEHNACAAALDMLARLALVNAEREREAGAGGHVYVPLDVGIGLNTGTCVVGNMGSTLRFDYSVLGDTVNIASRLEGQSKSYGAPIILGAETARIVEPDFAVLEIDRLRVKGKREPETVYALLGDAECRDGAAFQRLAATQVTLLERYRAQDWTGARAALEAARPDAERLRVGGLLALYAARLGQLAAAPPPPDWDGVHVADTK